VEAFESLCGSIHGGVFFGETKAHEAWGIGCHIKCGHGDGNDANFDGEAFAKGVDVTDAERGHVDTDEVGAIGVDDGQVGLAQNVFEVEAPIGVFCGELLVVAVVFGLGQRYCGGLLHGGRGGKGDPLMGGPERLIERCRRHGPADFPAGDAERFADAVDADGAFPHARQAGKVDVLMMVVDEAVVDFVDHRQCIVVLAELGDVAELSVGEDFAGRVVGRIEQNEFGALRKGLRQIGLRIPPATVLGIGWVEADGQHGAAGHDDVGQVGVVGRLKDHHFVARIDERKHHVAEELGGATRNTDFGEGVDVVSSPASPGGRDGLAQTRQAGHGCVLVEVGIDGSNGRLFDEIGASEIREALAEVDGLVLDGERTHLGKNGGAEGGNPVCGCRMAHGLISQI